MCVEQEAEMTREPLQDTTSEMKDEQLGRDPLRMEMEGVLVLVSSSTTISSITVYVVLPWVRSDPKVTLKSDAEYE